MLFVAMVHALSDVTLIALGAAAVAVFGWCAFRQVVGRRLLATYAAGLAGMMAVTPIAMPLVLLALGFGRRPYTGMHDDGFLAVGLATPAVDGLAGAVVGVVASEVARARVALSEARRKGAQIGMAVGVLVGLVASAVVRCLFNPNRSEWSTSFPVSPGDPEWPTYLLLAAIVGWCALLFGGLGDVLGGRGGRIAPTGHNL